MSQPDTHWREDLKVWAMRSASSIDDFIDIRWRYLKKRLGWDGVPRIQPYIGYANREQAWLHGRVLTNPPADLPGEDDNWWENIANTYQRFASNEVPDCEVELQLGDAVHRTTSDHEGYFFVNARHNLPSTIEGLWTTAAMQITNHSRVTAEQSRVTCRLMMPQEEATFGVISDVDDTILHTSATRLLAMAKVTFLNNARTRLPLAGAAALYQALQNAPKSQGGNHVNPIFYVSSSPWNLFDLLEDFLELNGLPLGPLLLRDLGFDVNKFLKEGHDHKLEKARRIMAHFPNLPFLLIGDSGQEDARLYATAAEEYGDQIRAIFIRDVDPDVASENDKAVSAAIQRAEAAGVPMHLVRDSIQAAEIACSLGVLEEDELPRIQTATAADRKRGLFI